MSQRFLLYFSYLGTKYNGMQRLVGRTGNQKDLVTIQGIIELGLQKVLQIPSVPLGIASRTDIGVHAIESAAHFDYHEPVPITTDKLCRNLNTFLESHFTDIRIRRIVQVPLDFAVRRVALSRTYCYRIAVPHHNFYDTCSIHGNVTGSIPITGLDRFQVVPPPFDPHLIFSACKIFLGTWNFKTFSKPPPKLIRLKAEEDEYIKTVKRISLTLSNSAFESSYYLDHRLKSVDFYDFHVEGSGFLRRQVRRMVGALLGIGTGAITEGEIRHMLENPSPTNWNIKCETAQAGGLYLKSVNFPEDLPIISGPLI